MHKSEYPAEEIDVTGIDAKHLDLDVSQEPNPWQVGSEKRMDFTRRLAQSYAPERVPREVITRLGILFAKQEENYRTGNTDAQRGTAAELKALVLRAERARSRTEQKDTLSGSVMTERRDNSGVEYVSILPAGTEATPKEWREKMRNLISRFTK